MENKKEILIDKHTKGVILFARRNKLARQLRRRDMVRYEWIILVHSVQKYNMDITSYKVNTHVSYCVTNGSIYVDDKKPGWWGDSNGYTFYEPTEEQKQMAFNILKERNLRFISPLNKLVSVKNN